MFSFFNYLYVCYNHVQWFYKTDVVCLFWFIYKYLMCLVKRWVIYIYKIIIVIIFIMDVNIIVVLQRTWDFISD